jgi:hypothetical protein
MISIETVLTKGYSDLVGRVQIPVKELIKTQNKMIDRTDPLMGFEDADTMPGFLQSVYNFIFVFNIHLFNILPCTLQIHSSIATAGLSDTSRRFL